MADSPLTIFPPFGDRFADIVVGAGPGGGPHVRVCATGLGYGQEGFFAYNPGFGGGVRVAATDLTGDGYVDIITAPGPGGGPHVRVLLTPTGSREFFAFDPAFLGGVFVG